MKCMNKLHGSKRNGWTLIELMIVLIVVAVLVALAYPSYTQYVRKAKRGEAQQLLMNWSVNQEIWRSNNAQYAADAASPTGILAPDHDDYTMTVGDLTASTYTLTATADGDQAADVEGGVACNVMTLNENGQKGPIECWGGKS